MGRLTNEEKGARNIQALIETIAKINDLDPILGGKWKKKMVDYYVDCLSKLILYQAGFPNPTLAATTVVEAGIRVTLLGNMGN